MTVAPETGERIVSQDEVLALDGVSLGYGDVPVVSGLDLTVRAGEIVALIGSNGAGKSTTIRGCVGLIPAKEGTVTLLGSTKRLSLHRAARAGVGLLPEERAIIPGLTVADNLRVAGVELDRVTAVFPEIEKLVRRKAGLLSGGEQQMLVLGRIFAADPKIIFADELSLGLAPQIVTRLLGALRDFASGGGAVLLVEQQVRHALSVADRVYVLRRGAVAMQGDAEDILRRVDEVEAMYL
jgi:branched-chain amino acid transport system ATP-binding protein